MEVISFSECLDESNRKCVALCLCIYISQFPVWTHLQFKCLLIARMTKLMQSIVHIQRKIFPHNNFFFIFVSAVYKQTVFI